ncbi:MAG TPA: dephospho-CoA kinase [Elusimicrobia bacterium]|nr:dephospho-CoA kinase [Elusimicrobiota bacterium]
MTAAAWKKRLASIKGKAVIGLTGPIASGKSLALDYFRKEGAFCVSADAVSAQVLTSPACYNRILRKFGSDKILTNGLLDKKRLAAEVFSSPAKRKWLEALLHPEILRLTYSLITKSRKKIVVVEAPLLFEAGLESCFMLTVCLTAPGKTLEARALKRGWTRREYRARAGAQFTPARKCAAADLALDNSGKPAELGARVRSICGFIKQIAREHERSTAGRKKL